MDDERKDGTERVEITEAEGQKKVRGGMTQDRTDYMVL